MWSSSEEEKENVEIDVTVSEKCQTTPATSCSLWSSRCSGMFRFDMFTLLCVYVKLMSRRLFTLQIVFKIYFLSHLCPYICVELNATFEFYLVIFLSLLFIDRMKKMVKIFHLHHLQIFHGSHQKLWIRQCLLPNLFEEMTHCGAVYKEGYQWKCCGRKWKSSKIIPCHMTQTSSTSTT